MAYDTVILNGVELQVVSMSPSRRPKTIKQIVGKNLAQTSILGATQFQWELSIRGILVADDTHTLEEKRNLLLSMENLIPYQYIDGLHNGYYYIEPGSLSFSDSGDDQFSVARYTMNLIQE